MKRTPHVVSLLIVLFSVGGQRPVSGQAQGTIIELGTLGGTVSAAWAINNLGQVVGESFTSGDASDHAFFWNNGLLTDLGALRSNYSSARGVNNFGQVVGFSGLGASLRHAFIW